MRKWLQLLTISTILCCFFSFSPKTEDIAALIVMAFGTSWVIDGFKKPIRR